MSESTLQNVLSWKSIETHDDREVVFAELIDGKFTLESKAITIPKHWLSGESALVYFGGVSTIVSFMSEFWETKDQRAAIQDLIDQVNEARLDSENYYDHSAAI